MAQQEHILFSVGDRKFTHLDLTGAEVEAIEKRFGIDWVEIRPIGVMAHRLAMLGALLARELGAEAAAAKVGAMTVGELEEAVTFVPGQDDLPDDYVDGLPDPKAAGDT